MGTAVVSVRVDQELKNQVSAIALSAGATVGDIVKHAFEEVVRTRQVPALEEEKERWAAQHKRFEEFMAWRATLPPCPELTTMTDEQMRDMIVSKYV